MLPPDDGAGERELLLSDSSSLCCRARRRSASRDEDSSRIRLRLSSGVTNPAWSSWLLCVCALASALSAGAAAAGGWRDRGRGRGARLLRSLLPGIGVDSLGAGGAGRPEEEPDAALPVKEGMLCALPAGEGASCVLPVLPVPPVLLPLASGGAAALLGASLASRSDACRLSARADLGLRLLLLCPSYVPTPRRVTTIFGRGQRGSLPAHRCARALSATVSGAGRVQHRMVSACGSSEQWAFRFEQDCISQLTVRASPLPGCPRCWLLCYGALLRAKACMCSALRGCLSTSQRDVSVEVNFVPSNSHLSLFLLPSPSLHRLSNTPQRTSRGSRSISLESTALHQPCLPHSASRAAYRRRGMRTSRRRRQKRTTLPPTHPPHPQQQQQWQGTAAPPWRSRAHHKGGRRPTVKGGTGGRSPRKTLATEALTRNATSLNTRSTWAS